MAGAARHCTSGPAHTGGDASIHSEQANVVHLGDLLNNRGYPNVDAPAGASAPADEHWAGSVPTRWTASWIVPVPAREPGLT